MGHVNKSITRSHSVPISSRGHISERSTRASSSSPSRAPKDRGNGSHNVARGFRNRDIQSNLIAQNQKLMGFNDALRDELKDAKRNGGEGTVPPRPPKTPTVEDELQDRLGFKLDSVQVPQSAISMFGYSSHVEWVLNPVQGSQATGLARGGFAVTTGDLATRHAGIMAAIHNGWMQVCDFFNPRAGDVRPPASRVANLFNAPLMLVRMKWNWQAPFALPLYYYQYVSRYEKIYTTICILVSISGFTVEKLVAFLQNKKIPNAFLESVKKFVLRNSRILTAAFAISALWKGVRQFALSVNNVYPTTRLYAPVLQTHALDRMGSDTTQFESVCRSGTGIFSTLGALNIPADVAPKIKTGSLEMARIQWLHEHPSELLDFILPFRHSCPLVSPYVPSGPRSRGTGGDEPPSPPADDTPQTSPYVSPEPSMISKKQKEYTEVVNEQFNPMSPVPSAPLKDLIKPSPIMPALSVRLEFLLLKEDLIREKAPALELDVQFVKWLPRITREAVRSPNIWSSTLYPGYHIRVTMLSDMITMTLLPSSLFPLFSDPLGPTFKAVPTGRSFLINADDSVSISGNGTESGIASLGTAPSF